MSEGSAAEARLFETRVPSGAGMCRMPGTDASQATTAARIRTSGWSGRSSSRDHNAAGMRIASAAVIGLVVLVWLTVSMLGSRAASWAEAEDVRADGASDSASGSFPTVRWARASSRVR